MLYADGLWIELVSEREKGYLSFLKGEFQLKGITSDCKLTTGSVVKEILDVAKKEEVDLIALCSHDRGGIFKLFSRDVASGILKHGDRPLLVIRN